MQRHKKIICTRYCIYLDILPQYTHVIKFLIQSNSLSITKKFCRKRKVFLVILIPPKSIVLYQLNFLSIDKKSSQYLCLCSCRVYRVVKLLIIKQFLFKYIAGELGISRFSIIFFLKRWRRLRYNKFDLKSNPFISIRPPYLSFKKMFSLMSCVFTLFLLLMVSLNIHTCAQIQIYMFC